MSYFPLTSVAKTLNTQASQANMRGTGLGISAAADAILDDANNGAILTTLGITAAAQTILDDASTTAIRTTLGADVGFVLEDKSADFTAADAKYYLVNSSGGLVTATLPAVGVGLKIGFKLVTAGNNLVLDGNASEQIEGAATFTMSVAGEQYFVRANTAGTAWIVE